MKLNLIEILIVVYWWAIETNSFDKFQYWIKAGVNVKYAFEKVYKNL